ncbi:putative membrane protein [Cohnella thailandensis]|nr:putative membrane protein [Cohnella thailandensis]
MMNGTVIAVASLYFLQALLIGVQNFFGPRALLFGVPIPAADTQDPAVRRIRVQYTILMGIFVLIVAAACFAWIRYLDAAHALVYLLAALLAQFPLSGLAIAICRQSALRLKATRGWQVPVENRRAASISNRRHRSPVLGLPWFGAHLAVIAVCIIIAMVKWNDIPVQFAIQWNADRIPDWYRWYSTKSIGSVFYENFGQLIGTGIFMLLNLVIGRTRTSLDPKDPEGSLQKQIRYKRINSFAIWGISLVVTVFLGLFQAGRIYSFQLDLWIHLTLALLLTAYLLLLGMVVYLRARGLDQQRDIPSQDNRYWKISGITYCNPDDPAIFVPKPYGMGWTVNMAKPMGRLAIAAIVGVPILLLVWVWLLIM